MFRLLGSGLFFAASFGHMVLADIAQMLPQPPAAGYGKRGKSSPSRTFCGFGRPNAPEARLFLIAASFSGAMGLWSGMIFLRIIIPFYLFV
jgi:hypothetical protein